MSNAQQAAPTGTQGRLRWLKPALMAVGAVALIGTWKVLPIADWIRTFLAWVDGLGTLGLIVLGVAYIIATVLFVPGLLLTMGAGALFGVIKGTICVSIASTLGATAAFLVGRYLARGAISERIEGNAKFEAVDKAVAREGWKIVGLTRLSPVFPFNLLNYAYGLTQVSLRDYFFASWIGMLPGTIMYVYIGSLGSDLATLGAAERAKTPLEWVLYIVGLVVTVTVTIFITRVAKKALNEAIAETKPHLGVEGI